MSARDDTRRAQEVRRRHAPGLMLEPGVVSVGVAYGDDGRPAIVVGMDSAEAAARFTAASPRVLDDVPVIARAVGSVEASD